MDSLNHLLHLKISPFSRLRPFNHMLTHSANAGHWDGGPDSSLCMPTSLLWVRFVSESMGGCSLKRTIWIQSISKHGAKQAIFSYIYSLGSDQRGSFRVNEKEQNTAHEDTKELVTYWVLCLLHIFHMFPAFQFLAESKTVCIDIEYVQWLCSPQIYD